MIRQGLDPASVIWLPRTKSPSDHLLQYSYVDVALDCFLMEAVPPHVSTLDGDTCGYPYRRWLC